MFEVIVDRLREVLFAKVAKIFFNFRLSYVIDDFRDKPGFVYPFKLPGVAKDGLSRILDRRVKLPPCVYVEGVNVGGSGARIKFVND